MSLKSLIVTHYSLVSETWVATEGPEPRLPGLGFSQSQLFWLSGAGVWCAKYRQGTHFA